jgi:hypothetical protein
MGTGQLGPGTVALGYPKTTRKSSCELELLQACYTAALRQVPNNSHSGHLPSVYFGTRKVGFQGNEVVPRQDRKKTVVNCGSEHPKLEENVKRR